MTKFNPENSAFNYLKGDEKRSFQSTRIYLDDDNKHLGSHIAYNDNVIDQVIRVNSYYFYRSTSVTLCLETVSQRGPYSQTMRS